MVQAVSSEASSGAKRRNEGEWSWWDETNSERLGNDGGARAWMCKHCGFKRKSGTTKVRAHILCLPGFEVQPCKAMATEKKAEFLAKDTLLKAKSNARPKKRAIDPNHLVFPSSTPTSSASSGGPSSFSTLSSSPSLPRRRQRTLDRSWDPQRKADVDVSVDGSSVAHSALIGGEVEALKRLKSFAAEHLGQETGKSKGTVTGANLYGSNFSCKISPWLAMGCLSPRRMFEDLQKSAKRGPTATASGPSVSSDNGLNWLVFELLWRDFFRFITKKYAVSKQTTEVVTAAPVPV
ncbi:hypothetical protein L7F22_013777 [Adiantum nelumboides]|nr:hypothetical protein [Adiantum nelumboides]